MKTEKCKSLWVWAVTFLLTVLVTFLKKFEPGNVNAIWLIWIFCSWNFFAYAFDKNMCPWQFEELYGQGRGKPSNRSFYFWGTAAIYLAFLAVAAFADK
jgi:hypothetical protein